MQGELSMLLKEVREPLEDHREVLEVPTTLPLPRTFDHHIVLVGEGKLVNVPSTCMPIFIRMRLKYKWRKVEECPFPP